MPSSLDGRLASPLRDGSKSPSAIASGDAPLEWRAPSELHPMVAVKLWENPCWFTFRLNYLGLQFNLPVHGWIEERYGLVRPEYAVLYALGLRDGIAAKDVCASTGFPKNTISRAIQKLLRRKLIRRVPDARDRRSFVLRLAAEGQRIVDETVPSLVAREKRMLAGLSREEQRILASLLGRMVVESRNWPTHLDGESK